jgi:hypothetical protein
VGNPNGVAMMAPGKWSGKTPRGSLTHFLPLFASRSCHAPETSPAPRCVNLPRWCRRDVATGV